MNFDCKTQSREANAVLFSNWASDANFKVQSGAKISYFSILYNAKTALLICTVLSVFDAYSVDLDENTVNFSIMQSV
jgi:hypothetical protein